MNVSGPAGRYFKKTLIHQAEGSLLSNALRFQASHGRCSVIPIIKILVSAETSLIILSVWERFNFPTG
jgi:hypothetical protein